MFQTTNQIGPSIFLWAQMIGLETCSWLQQASRRHSRHVPGIFRAACGAPHAHCRPMFSLGWIMFINLNGKSLISFIGLNTMKVMFLPFWCWISYPFFNRFWRCLWLWPGPYLFNQYEFIGVLHMFRPMKPFPKMSRSWSMLIIPWVLMVESRTLRRDQLRTAWARHVAGQAATLISSINSSMWL